MIAFIKDKKIQISVYFALLLTLVFALSPQGYAPTGLVCCLLHETGHLICMKIAGCKIKGVTFGVYGMRIDSDAPLSFKKEALVALGGPATNIFLAVIGFALGNRMFAVANCVIAVFNLLPVDSTDGYSALKSLLCIRFEAQKIKATLNIISAAFLFLMYCFGFLLLFKSGYNFSALAVSIYLTVKFLFQGNQLYR